MNLKDLQYIITVAKYGNITKAADNMFVAQPSLSRDRKSTRLNSSH